jgi:hypothetical protein
MRERMLKRVHDHDVPALVVWAYGDHSGPPRWLQKRAERPNKPQLAVVRAPDDIDGVLQAVCDFLGVVPPGWVPPRWALSAI